MKQFFKTVFASTLGVLVALGIVTMGSIFFIIGVAASADGSSEYKPDKNTVFKLSLDGVLVDQAVKNRFLQALQGLRRSAASWRTLRIAVSLSCHTAIIIRRGLITCVA